MMAESGGLPPLTQALESMTQTDLRSFIPVMLRSSTGRCKPAYGNNSHRPVWWPQSIPYQSPHDNPVPNAKPKAKSSAGIAQRTLDLRKVVKSCYKYHHLEYMLNGQENQSCYTGNQSKHCSPNNTPTSDRQWSYKPYHSVSGCPEPPSPPTAPGASSITLAEKDADLPQQSRTGQWVMGSRSQAANQNKVKSVITERDGSFKEVFLCLHCEREFESRQELQDHFDMCALGPPRLEPPGSPVKSTWRPAPLITPKTFSPGPPRRADKMKFIDALGLERSGMRRQRRDTADVDCEIIDLDEEPLPPQTPTTPRTPRSLMSQLSTPVSRQNSQRCDIDTLSESGKSDISDDDVRKPLSTKSLLNIDVSSLLGQRIKNHINVDYLVSRIHSCYEEFCRTPVKNDATDRLRFRGNINQVTYKPKRTAQKFCHTYKFTRKDRQEFLTKLKTGLNCKSRELLAQTKPCKVVLAHLNKRQLIKWKVIRRPQRPPIIDLTCNTISVFPPSPQPSELCRLLGMKTKRDREHTPEPLLLLSQVVSEDIHAEVTQQQLLMYKTVLSSAERNSQKALLNNNNNQSGVRRPLTLTADPGLTPPPSPTSSSPPVLTVTNKPCPKKKKVPTATLR